MQHQHPTKHGIQLYIYHSPTIATAGPAPGNPRGSRKRSQAPRHHAGNNLGHPGWEQLGPPGRKRWIPHNSWWWPFPTTSAIPASHKNDSPHPWITHPASQPTDPNSSKTKSLEHNGMHTSGHGIEPAWHTQRMMITQ